MNHEDDFALEPELASLLDAERSTTDLAPAHAARLAARFEEALAESPDRSGTNDPPSPPLPGASAGSGAAPVAARFPPWVRAALLLSTGALFGAAGHALLARDADPTVGTTQTEARASAPTAPTSATSATTAPPRPPPSSDDRPDAVDETRAEGVRVNAPSPPGSPPSNARTAPPSDAPHARVQSPQAPPGSAAPSSSTNGPGPAPIASGGDGTASEAELSAPSRHPERLLVERARAAVARSDGLSALEALEEHRRRYPDGQFAEERDALLVDALVLQGRADDARRKAREFLTRYPRSVFTRRVELLLAP